MNNGSTMRAARWYGRRDVRVEKVDVPVPGPGEVLLRVGWCGICGTDVEEYLEGPIVIPVGTPNSLTGRMAPLTMGHEFAGQVAEVGPDVGNLRVGDRVVPEVALFCGTCYFCLHHQYALCVNWAALGLMGDGGLAEYVTVSASMCVKAPDALTDEECALVEPTEVAVRAVAKGGVKLGSTVAILGGGTIGLLTLQVARAAGASEVYLIARREARRQLGRNLGATFVFDPENARWVDELREACGGIGPDVVIECAGSRDAADLSIRAARKAGTIVLAGVTAEQVLVNTLEILAGEKHVVGTVQHHYDDDLPVAIRLLAEGKVLGKPLITSRIGLGSIVEGGFMALKDYGQGHLKILVSPDL